MTRRTELVALSATKFLTLHLWGDFTPINRAPDDGLAITESIERGRYGSSGLAGDNVLPAVIVRNGKGAAGKKSQPRRSAFSRWLHPAANIRGGAEVPPSCPSEA
jgi:hypothetical protein